MNQVLEQTLTGAEPVTVNLGGKAYPLAFPLHACALYQAETVKLDRARRAAHGALTAALRQELKARRWDLLRQTDPLQEQLAALAALEKERALTAEERTRLTEITEQYYELLGEAMAARNRLDEDAARGDSLFLEANWFKINSDDPERVVLALWAGLHQPVASGQLSVARNQDEWSSPFTVQQLRHLLDPSNAEEIIDAISQALRVYAVKKKQRQDGKPRKRIQRSDDGDDVEPIGIPQLWAIARVDLRLSEREFLSLSPAALDLLMERLAILDRKANLQVAGLRADFLQRTSRSRKVSRGLDGLRLSPGVAGRARRARSRRSRSGARAHQGRVRGVAGTTVREADRGRQAGSKNQPSAISRQLSALGDQRHCRRESAARRSLMRIACGSPADKRGSGQWSVVSGR